MWDVTEMTSECQPLEVGRPRKKPLGEPTHFGRNLGHLRRKRGLSYSRLALKVRVSSTALQRWETDSAEEGGPRLFEVKRVAEFFGVSVDYLIDHVPEPQDEDDSSAVTEKEIRLLELYRDKRYPDFRKMVDLAMKGIDK